MSDITRTAVLGDGDTLLTIHKYAIHVTDPKGEQTSFPFVSRSLVIGSSPDAEVTLDDPNASRLHCQIEIDARGYRLRDLGSKNGTFVGGMQITDVYLVPGAIWKVGQHSMLLELGEEEVEIRLSGSDRFSNLIGSSAAMREVFGLLSRVAPTDATVLVEGESGTGKELVAQAIHEHSLRNDGPFVIFDCSAVARDLVESELFGHVRGAFTGAVTTREGAFSRASGGTLFLDEIGELPLELQPKLLRALDSSELRAVGGAETKVIDTRIVAATNRKLKREVSEGNFREDLYYRLAVIRVGLPPLRRRTEDIPQLAEHFLEVLSGEDDSDLLGISFSTMEKLKRHRWPGNVRELKNFIERAAVLADGDRVETRFLRLGNNTRDSAAGALLPSGFVGGFEIDEDIPFKDAKNRLVEAFEKAYWTRLLERTSGNISKAARIAGVHRKSVEYIMKKLDLRRGDIP